MPKLPSVNKTSKSNMMSSQSVDQFADGTVLPNIKGASKKSKRESKDDMVASRKQAKRSSKEGMISAKKSKRKSTEGARPGVAVEDGETSARSKKKVKTSRVHINPRKLQRQMSSVMYVDTDDNPLRKFVTKNLRDPESPAAMTDIKTFWLYAVSLVSRTAFLNCLTNSPCAYASPLAIELAQKRLAANMRLVLYIKQRCLWFRNKIKVKTDFIRNHGWKLVLFWRCMQRRKAVKLLRRMLSDFETFRLPYVMLRYRVNAVHLQRYVRSFLEVTESRKHVLFLKWNKVSAHMKANLIPFLFDQKAREDEARKRREANKWQGVEINAEVLPSIGARVNLITKRTAALQVQIQSSEAKIQKHRMEMFAKRNKKRKQQLLAKLPALEGDGDDEFFDEDDESEAKSPSSKNETVSKTRALHNVMDREQMDDNKKVLQIISKFIYECRRTCKFMEQHKVIVREKKKKDGMTCEEAKRILTNPFAAMTFAEDIASTEVRLEKISLLIFTGQQDYAFRLIIENYLRAENGFELKEYCTEYESNYQSKAKRR
eukprot:CAMPEP_0114428700 /NCGR_PEP_ID=MMETSP0103-20121206/9076_1 /TAXON_ID=37642 ORGANISM="Paraphysomonas imperforata, Strain PA2" /NCGR_SAMPLE_ID=MMETSP0103 /ASSEMBLY_ACC=CAM_ASM_000201 /LENGTH=543 /DNA_ID=CAMNT_0001597955 /DNA_START=171 /DNA_END=1802 /DNA_ORIENTATION=-